LGYAPLCRNLFLMEFFDLASLISRLVSEIEEVLGVRVFLPKGLKVEIVSGCPFARGRYDPLRRIITLCDNRWCRKTFIHEFFHATSYLLVGL